MNLYGPLMRAIALAGLATISALATLPAQAGRADVELLHSYLGKWRGKGTLVSASGNETVGCVLELMKGNQDKVNFQGNCAIAGTKIPVSGTLAYVDSARRFEARMKATDNFDGVAVGRKQGNGVVFNLRDQRVRDEEGNEMTISSQFALNSGKINVEFNVLFNNSGERLRASVPFSK